MNKEREKFNRRIGLIDRRKKRFGRRGAQWLITIANWVTVSPTAFFIYLIFSLLSIIYTAANLTYNINQLLIDYFEKLILH
jgi:hypothetical protein